MDSKRIGTFLKELRTEKRLTQKEIAEHCSLSAQAVSKWEKGDSIPDVEQLERLSAFYEITINEILLGERRILDKTTNRNQYIVRLLLSIIVFLAYAFNYVEIEFAQGFGWIDQIFRGYELIFDGLGGGVYAITMIIFVILISHFLLLLLITLNAFHPNDKIEFYLFCTTMLVIFVSIFKLSFPSFYPFPQIWIILTMITSLFVLIQNRPELGALIKYRKYAKATDISGDLKLTETPTTTSQIKKSRSHYLVLIVAYISLATFFTLGVIDSFMSHSSTQGDFNSRLFFLTAATMTLVLALILAYFYAAIGSEHSSLILAIAAFSSILLMLSGSMLGAPVSLISLALGLYLGVNLSINAYRLNQV